jgi:hypothetical protein
MATANKNPIKAIQAFCLACNGGDRSGVKECPDASCDLFAFRAGTNPYRSGKMTEKQREARLRNLKAGAAKRVGRKIWEDA